MKPETKKLGEAATSSELGSNIHRKDIQMNSKEHSTGSPAAPVPASDAKVADAMRNLENDIRELMLMADIAANAWDNIGPPKQFCENGFRYECTRLERDSFDFLINNVAVRADALRKKFDAATQGEELA